jgi:hypothetical protein
MGTLPPPQVQKSPESSLEKKVYNIVESFKEYLPVANDRNRLGFNLFKYVKGEGDHPSIIVKNAKVKIKGISEKELAEKLTAAIEKIS